MIKNICFKSLMLLLALLLLQSCSSFHFPRAKDYITTVDYTKYLQEGFFITESNSVNFDYDPVATVYVLSYEGETDPNSGAGSGWYVDQYGYSRQSGDVDWAFPYPAGVLDKAVKAAKEKGADAIINLSFTPTTRRPFKNENFTLSGLLVTGMAIKRK